MKEKEVVEENEEEEGGISKFCHIHTSSHTDIQIQYSKETENTLFGGRGLGSTSLVIFDG